MPFGQALILCRRPANAILLSAVRLFPQFTGVERFQLGIRRSPRTAEQRKKDELDLILSTIDLQSDPQDGSLHRSGRECLVPLVGGELNPKFASGRQRIHRVLVHIGFEALRCAAIATRSASSVYTGST